VVVTEGTGTRIVKVHESYKQVIWGIQEYADSVWREALDVCATLVGVVNEKKVRRKRHDFTTSSINLHGVSREVYRDWQRVILGIIYESGFIYETGFHYKTPTGSIGKHIGKNKTKQSARHVETREAVDANAEADKDAVTDVDVVAHVDADVHAEVDAGVDVEVDVDAEVDAEVDADANAVDAEVDAHVDVDAHADVSMFEYRYRSSLLDRYGHLAENAMRHVIVYGKTYSESGKRKEELP
jgi:hypothetical protein